MRSLTKQNALYLALGTVLALTVQKVYQYMMRKKNRQVDKNGLLDCIGKTPLIYLPKLSKALNCEIFAKVEFMNPFGSSKDRAVKHMLNKALLEGYFNENKEVVEASSGSTAITLVQTCKIMGLCPTIFLTDDLSQDKYSYLQTLGAHIVKVPQVSIVDSNHFYNKARDYAKERGAFFMNQFQNLNNTEVHYKFTGPEIYQQMNHQIDAFVCSAGTGGTIAGVSKYLKQKNQNIDVILADPEGSGLFNKIKYNVLFTAQEKEGHRLKNPFDTVVQGVGLTRPTKNFQQAIIDDAYKIKDIEALHLSHYLIENEGLFLGGSCSVNLSAVIKYCRKHPGSRVVTILHDSGNRYLRKFYSQQYLHSKNCNFSKLQSYPENDLSFIK